MVTAIPPIIMKVYLIVGGIAVTIFTVAVIQMAAVNEIPENELNKDIKKDRQEEMIERSKEAVKESNN